MFTLIVAAVLAAGPPTPRFAELTPPVPKFRQEIMPASEWLTQVVGNVTIELPVPEAIETAEYTRTAPDNYKIPTIHWSKSVPVWCPVPGPRHGFACGMHKTVEDVAGHLQEAHGVPLETLNEMGRDKWQSYHEDLEWCDETPERQEQFLHPAQAKPAVKSGCASGNCPKPSYTQSRGWGWRR